MNRTSTVGSAVPFGAEFLGDVEATPYGCAACSDQPWMNVANWSADEVRFFLLGG